MLLRLLTKVSCLSLLFQDLRGVVGLSGFDLFHVAEEEAACVIAEVHAVALTPLPVLASCALIVFHP